MGVTQGPQKRYRRAMAEAEKPDLYKLQRGEYVKPRKPPAVKCGRAKHLAVSGNRPPGEEPFQQAIGALYAFDCALKFSSEAAGRDYKVCNLEWFCGAWGSKEWNWDLVVRVPEFIGARELKAARAKLAEKENPAPASVRLMPVSEGICVQMLHVGPYSDEARTSEEMRSFAAPQGLGFHGRHHEICISDPRRAAPEKLKTILRMPVRKAA